MTVITVAKMRKRLVFNLSHYFISKILFLFLNTLAHFKTNKRHYYSNFSLSRIPVEIHSGLLVNLYWGFLGVLFYKLIKTSIEQHLQYHYYALYYW
jgi:hypothetical protein